MKIFFLLIIGGYAFINAWILWWVWRALAGTGALRLCVFFVILIWSLCFPLLYKSPGNSWPEIALFRAGAFWLGIFIYVFALALLADAYGLAGKFLGLASANRPRLQTCLFVIGLPFLIGCAGWLNAAFPVVKKYELAVRVDRPIPESDKGLTIAAISDLHLGKTITAARLERAVNLLLPHKPDVVFFLGDMLDDHIRLDIEGLRTALSPLRPRLGLWGIAGNHEYHAGDDIDKSLAVLEQIGLNMLRDEWRVLDGGLLLVGRDDPAGERLNGRKRKSLDDILRTVPDVFRDFPLIVLDHQPNDLGAAQKAGAALQLSGHTHYGQIWPFNLVVDRLFENARGRSRRGETHYLVSVGTGTWGPPIRNTARPEVLLARIRFLQRDGPETGHSQSALPPGHTLAD
ncbi:MAG: metallophosphoesterase [Candidatus Adiutrix sp.]|jgi:predicted MPP superfamily phosphohydrolase|nr:metallophosphoesterase [Candidatus Adiutrix sp.]